MSTHFVDLQLLPDPEFTAPDLLSALYGRLHKVLAQERCETLAVSFPGYDQKRPALGTCMRLLGSADDLNTLMAQPWLGGIQAHTRISPVAAVPANAVPRTLRRVQAKSNPARLRRRLMRRHGLTEEQAKERLPDSVSERLDLPFVTMASSSTGQRFRLYLRLGPPEQHATGGRFNSYGLSTTATVPWF